MLGQLLHSHSSLLINWPVCRLVAILLLSAITLVPAQVTEPLAATTVIVGESTDLIQGAASDAAQAANGDKPCLVPVVLFFGGLGSPS